MGDIFEEGKVLIDFEKKSIKGYTKAKDLKRQFEVIKNVTQRRIFFD